MLLNVIHLSIIYLQFSYSYNLHQHYYYESDAIKIKSIESQVNILIHILFTLKYFWEKINNDTFFIFKLYAFDRCFPDNTNPTAIIGNWSNSRPTYLKKISLKLEINHLKNYKVQEK